MENNGNGNGNHQKKTRTVAQQRNYRVLDVRAAKEIASLWLQAAQLENVVVFGLPEVDDRYHIWRVPLLHHANQERIGEVVIDAHTSLILEDKSTAPANLEARLLGRQQTLEATATEIKSPSSRNGSYKLSTMRNTIACGDSEDILQDLPAESKAQSNSPILCAICPLWRQISLPARKFRNGKLFEKLVLGSLLSILGFTYDESSKNVGDGVFWLSTQGEKRESDATLLYKMGQGVRFDIGFIGRGNPEIILDKVSRFQRQEEIRGARWYMATIVIVDRLGKGSRVEALAHQIGGSVVQMSASYWPQEVARLLKQAFGFEHPLINMQQSQVEDFLKEKLQEVPIESFLRNLPAEDLLENGQ